MILRRLGEAFAEQNWFIVVIEVLVVVVGILMGLQVDDWNAARKDRKDEQKFLQRLHADVLLAEELSSRVRTRRLDSLQTIMDASDVLFGRVERDTVTDEECIAIGSANFFNISAPGLPSLVELVGTGRLGIIQDTELRSSLIGLQQTRAALSTMIAVQSGSSSFTHLPSTYPELMRMTSYYDIEVDEIRARIQCDVAKMRANQAFLNQWSVNADGYDAYIRDGLAPWSAQLDGVHQLIDDALVLDHGADQNQ
jgi:hypothetical protein